MLLNEVARLEFLSDRKSSWTFSGMREGLGLSNRSFDSGGKAIAKYSGGCNQTFGKSRAFPFALAPLIVELMNSRWSESAGEHKFVGKQSFAIFALSFPLLYLGFARSAGDISARSARPLINKWILDSATRFHDIRDTWSISTYSYFCTRIVHAVRERSPECIFTRERCTSLFALQCVGFVPIPNWFRITGREKNVWYLWLTYIEE